MAALSSVEDRKPRFLNSTALMELGLIFMIIPAICFYGRAVIFDFLVRPFAAKQRLHDGVFIAALLDAEAPEDAQTAGEDGEDQDGGVDLIADTAALMRRVPMSRITLAMLGASPRDEDYDAAAAFALGEACGLGGCDVSTHAI